MHGSPWRLRYARADYFSGPGIKAQTVHRLVHLMDEAPTITAFLGISPPAAAQGKSLKDVLR